MAATTHKISKKQQEILKLLVSSEDILIQKGLIELKSSGEDAIIPDLFEIFINSDNELLTEGLKAIFFEIKSPNAINAIFNILKKDKSNAHQATLISIIWQAGLDAHDYMNELVKLAINGDFMTCFECLTVIENFDKDFQESVIIENSVLLKEAIDSRNPNEELLRTMHEVIQNLMLG